MQVDDLTVVLGARTRIAGEVSSLLGEKDDDLGK